MKDYDKEFNAIQEQFLQHEIAENGFQRYYPDHQTAKVFNDMLGFRTLCDNYEDILLLKECRQIRTALKKGIRKC